jgi:hypothetical protein
MVRKHNRELSYFGRSQATKDYLPKALPIARKMRSLRAKAASLVEELEKIDNFEWKASGEKKGIIGKISDAYSSRQAKKANEKERAKVLAKIRKVHDEFDSVVDVINSNWTQKTPFIKAIGQKGLVVIVRKGLEVPKSEVDSDTPFPTLLKVIRNYAKLRLFPRAILRQVLGKKDARTEAEKNRDRKRLKKDVAVKLGMGRMMRGRGNLKAHVHGYQAFVDRDRKKKDKDDHDLKD